MQNGILFLLGIPAAIAAQQPHAPLGSSDYALGAASLLCLAGEFVADNQQFAFQTFKHSGGKRDPRAEWPGARIAYSDEDRQRGFITRGLWAWSRHPNFFFEQLFWVRRSCF
jgi:steroid 5-alpha reductase family enzyme